MPCRPYGYWLAAECFILVALMITGFDVFYLESVVKSALFYKSNLQIQINKLNIILFINYTKFISCSAGCI